MTTRGKAFLIKKDIFKNLMWYTLPDSSKQYPLTIQRVIEIKQQNAQGVAVEELQPVEVVSTKAIEKEPEFVDVVGHMTLQSLEKKKQRPQQQNGPVNRNSEQRQNNQSSQPQSRRQDGTPQQGKGMPQQNRPVPPQGNNVPRQQRGPQQSAGPAGQKPPMQGNNQQRPPQQNNQRPLQRQPPPGNQPPLTNRPPQTRPPQQNRPPQNDGRQQPPPNRQGPPPQNGRRPLPDKPAPPKTDENNDVG